MRLLITAHGPPGSGKTTALNMLEEFLTRQGFTTSEAGEAALAATWNKTMPFPQYYLAPPKKKARKK